MGPDKRALFYSGLAALAGAAMELGWHLEFNDYLFRSPLPVTLGAVAVGAAAFTYALFWGYVFSLGAFRRNGSAPPPLAALVAATAAPILWRSLPPPPWPPPLPLIIIPAVSLTVAGGVGLALAALLRRGVTTLVTLAAAVAALTVVVVTNHRVSSRATPLRRPDVVVVTVAGIGADRLGCYGYAAARTPRLDELARGGWRPGRCVTAGPSSAEAHALILSSRPHAAGPYLPALLKKAGYVSAAFVSSAALAADRVPFARTFDRYDDNLTPASSYRPSPLVPKFIARHFAILKPDVDPKRRGARDVTETAVRWARAQGQKPKFILVNYGDAEPPYTPPSDFVRPGLGGYPLQLRLNKRWLRTTKPSPSLVGHINELYDGEIAYVDAQVGRLLDALGRYASPAGRLIIVAGDRGQYLGPADEDDEMTWQAELDVPLLFTFSGEMALVPPPVASLADVAPTVLDILQIPTDDGMIGESMLRPGRRDGVYTVVRDKEGAVVAEIWTTPSERLVSTGGGLHLYALDDGRSADVAPTNPDRAHKLASDLLSYRRRVYGRHQPPSRAR